MRRGNALVLMAVLLPVLIGIVGFVIDTGLMMDQRRNLQHAADAAALAAATDLRLKHGNAAATTTATNLLRTSNGLGDATVDVHIPPTSGTFSGDANHVEVVATRNYQSYFTRILDGVVDRSILARAVAGVRDATEDAAIVVLDQDPAPLSVAGILTLPALPTLTAGLEVEGVGRLNVEGAVLVNTEWGGEDENGDPAGVNAGPPYGVACMPLLPTSRLRASDIRVTGGVDDRDNYKNISTGEPSPLQANRLPVLDPYQNLPVPTTASDPANVSAVYRGPRTVVGLPIIGPPVNLQPGVYDYIRVISGVANFAPGVYIIRSRDPITQTSLSMVAGTVNAQGVMFYITNSSGYDAASGSPDAGDGENEPANGVGSLVPSVLIQAGLLGSGISGINSASSPFRGMTIYQRRQDRRPIVIANQNLLGTGSFAGTVYAKWGHVILAGNGTYDMRIVCGTMRALTVFDTTLAPSTLLEPAQDVYLLE